MGHFVRSPSSFVELDSGKVSTRFDFRPSVGVHLVSYGGTWFRVERTREQRLTEPWETVQLTAFGNKRDVVVRMLDEAREMVMAHYQGKTVMYTVIGTDWRPFGHPRSRRPLESVVLDGTLAGDILEDVRSFTTSAAWYRRRGIPYRRGYLVSQDREKIIIKSRNVSLPQKSCTVLPGAARPRS